MGQIVSELLGGEGANVANNSASTVGSCNGRRGAEGATIELLLLPIVDETNWSKPLRAFLYLLALIYLFVGISIGVDVFMSAIEKV